MRNEFKTTVNVNRGEICDLILACHSVYYESDARKWLRLADKLKAQLDELDAQLDDIENN